MFNLTRTTITCITHIQLSRFRIILFITNANTMLRTHMSSNNECGVILCPRCVTGVNWNNKDYKISKNVPHLFIEIYLHPLHHYKVVALQLYSAPSIPPAIVFASYN